jgi:hypothetical protein
MKRKKAEKENGEERNIKENRKSIKIDINN